MDVIRGIGGDIILLASILGAALILGRWAKPQIKRVLDIDSTTPSDVYDLVLEIHTAMMILLAYVSEDENPSEEDIQEAMATLQKAGIMDGEEN